MHAQEALFPVPEAAPRALTVRQPWASLIMAGIKDVENRTWATPYRGTLLVHAGACADREAMAARGHLVPGCPQGAILGTIVLVDVVRDSGSPWGAAGQWHWVLEGPRPVDPVAAKGALGLWAPGPALRDQVSAALA